MEGGKEWKLGAVTAWLWEEGQRGAGRERCPVVSLKAAERGSQCPQHQKEPNLQPRMTAEGKATGSGDAVRTHQHRGIVLPT